MAKDGTRTRLTTDDPADTVLMSALASGASYSRAAELAGVSKATVKRRMATPDFRARVEELRADHVRRAERRLGELSVTALNTLEALLAQTDAPAQRLGAAKAVLSGLLSMP